MDNNSRKRSKLMVLPIVIIAVCTLVWFSYRYFEPINVDAIFSSLVRYEEAVIDHEMAVVTPGAKSNTSRIELDAILVKILTEPMEEAVRINYSKMALEKIDILDKQIALVYEAGSVVEVRIDSLVLASKSVKGIEAKMKVGEIINLAIKQKGIIDEIDVLTKVITDSTRSIFDRIIEDGGMLTDEHMVSLNNQITEAETRFDKRTSLFSEMDKNKKAIENLSTQLRNLAYK